MSVIVGKFGGSGGFGTGGRNGNLSQLISNNGNGFRSRTHLGPGDLDRLNEESNTKAEEAMEKRKTNRISKDPFKQEMYVLFSARV